MAVLEKIRVKFGVLITVIIAIALLSFIIDPNTLASVSQSMSSKYDVGKINGKSVSYTDFQQDIENFTTISEILSGSSVQSEEQQKGIRDAAWQSLIDKHLFLKEAKSAGIVVGDDELYDLSVGDNVSPIISQLGMFRDQNGNFSKQAVADLVANLDNDQDPTHRAASFWNYLENTVLTEQYRAKYYSLFSQSDLINPLMLANKIEENNNTVDASFISVPVNMFAPDSTITVTDKEIKDRYNSQKKFYKQDYSRSIEYVVYQAVPSRKDIDETKAQVQKVYEEFGKTANMKSFLLQNSDRQLSDYYYSATELNTVSKEVNDFVAANKPGAVSEIMANDQVIRAVRVLDEQNLPERVYVHAFPYANVEKADSICNLINKKGQSFDNVATLNSVGQQYNYEGWMNQSNAIDKSVMTAPLNKAYSFIYQNIAYILQVTDRADIAPRKSVAILERNIIPSQETRNVYYAKANKTASLAGGKYKNFQAAVDSVGGYVQTVSRLAEGAEKIGSIDNAKEVSRWAFEAKKNHVSEVITVNNDCFFVAVVTGINKEGYTPVETVAPTIKSQLMAEKAVAKKAAEISTKLQGVTDIDEAAKLLEASVSTREAIAFSAANSRSLDPKFLGALAGADDNLHTVAGVNSVYVFKVTGRDTGSFFTEDDAKKEDVQFSSYNARMILPVMMEMSGVKDNRARFF